MHAFAITPLLLLGAGEAALVVYAVVSSMHALMQHSNADLRTGRLRYIFSTPELHRWHHTKTVNFGAFFSIWDTLFGTYYHSNTAQAPDDTASPRLTSSLWRQLLWPFSRK